MLTPKRVKWRKVASRPHDAARRCVGNTLTFGDYGLQALEPCWMTNRQIEAARIAMTRHIKRGGKVWIKIFPDKSVTKKPAEVRMGSGKGNPEFWVAVIRPGRVLFETRRRDRAHRARSAAPGFGQVADRDQDRLACRIGGCFMKNDESDHAALADRRRTAAARPATRRKSCSTCASSCVRATSPISAAVRAVRRAYASIQTVISEKRLAEAKHGAA